VTDDAGGVGLLRQRGGGTRVTYLELFFDLVYVFAVTQLAHLLLSNVSWAGAARTGLLLAAVWWAWIDTAWVTNWFDPGGRPVRLMLLTAMLASLVMSAAVPGAYGKRALAFAIAYAAMQVGRPLFVILAAPRREAVLRRNFDRILVWRGISAALWIAGAVLAVEAGAGDARTALWCVAVAVDFTGPAAGFYLPGWGSSPTNEWNIAGGHLAERCQLFVIIALGEGILLTGASVTDMSATVQRSAAFVVAFVGAVALWWIYFDRIADFGAAVIGSSDDPGRLGRSAYTYFHLPMVAGIVLSAVADELVIAHPGGDLGWTGAVLTLGGPALFLAGHALFKWSLTRRVPASRLAAAGALVALVPLARYLPPVAAALLPVAAIAVVAALDAVHASRNIVTQSAPPPSRK
jgi:low temperature requirement protein LtrA